MSLIFFFFFFKKCSTLIELQIAFRMLTRAHASLSDLDKLKGEVKQAHEPQTDQVEGTETYRRMGRWMHVAQIIMSILCIMYAIDN